jgi:hypothetical protein
MTKEYLKEFCQRVFPDHDILIEDRLITQNKGLTARIKKDAQIIHIEFKESCFAIDPLSAAQLLQESNYILGLLYEAKFKYAWQN